MHVSIILGDLVDFIIAVRSQSWTSILLYSMVCLLNLQRCHSPTTVTLLVVVIIFIICQSARCAANLADAILFLKVRRFQNLFLIMSPFPKISLKIVCKIVPDCASCCFLSKPKVTMTSLCSTAAPDCRTGQSIGRYGKQESSILLVLVYWDNFEYNFGVNFLKKWNDER